MLRVKNNIAVPTRKLHGEVRLKRLEFGFFPLARCAPKLIHSKFNNVYRLSWDKNQQLNCETIPETKWL
jgi:hypothetical protein